MYSELLLSFGKCKCQCDISCCLNDNSTMFSLHTKIFKNVWCELTDIKTLYCSGD